MASASNLNLTKPNPLFFLEALSTGMKESTILPARQNMASNSTVEISSGKLETKKEKHSCLSARILGGSGLYLAPSLEDLGLSLRSSEEPKDQTRLLPFLCKVYLLIKKKKEKCSICLWVRTQYIIS